MILLTGITGNNGGATAEALLAKGIKFRALVRDLDKAASWGERGVELVKGDLSDPTSISAALEGIDRAVLILPNGEQQQALEAKFIQTCKEAGLPWIIKLSSPEAIRGTNSPIPLAHIAGEDAIIESGMNYTFIRPSFFMQNFRSSLNSARQTGKLSMPMSDGTIALTDTANAGEFFAKVLTDEGSERHYGKTYDICGPDPVMNFADVAKVIGEVIGQDVEYDDCDAAAYQEAIRPYHLNDWHSDAVADLFAEIANGGTPGHKTETFQEMMGKPGISLKEYLQKVDAG
ncbi:MAG: NmrA family NAD(P)-binding protein [Gammaproteobacteria bacterium]|nr:NmrA family NAD(P)-binding protein [Gammaproteobacteria bacterium]